MGPENLYQTIGGRETCLRLSETFYSRVKRDPVLRPLFPGKSMRCAIDAFAAFLAQFLGGPSEDANQRWYLSLRESHLRFAIGPRERQAWMNNMREAIQDLPVDEPIRCALRDLFERSSAYIANTDPSHHEPSHDPIHREVSKKWDQQLALDDLVSAIRVGDSRRALALVRSPALEGRLSRDRAVFAHLLGLMVAGGNPTLLEYVERRVIADPSLARVRNRYGRTLLIDASARKNLHMVELLLRLGADPNVGTHPPLYHVANEFPMTTGGEIVRALVRAGALVDERSDSKKCTALHMAARRGNAEVAEALIDCGADINARDRTGVTPLQRAKNCRKPAVASLLVARGA